MDYTEFTVTTTDLGEELVSDIFWDYTDFGVAVCSLKDVISLLKDKSKYDYYDDKILALKDNVCLVKGYIEKGKSTEFSKQLNERLSVLRERSPFDLGSLEVVTRGVGSDDWIEVWRQHFKPIKFDKLTICPKWIECKDNNTIYLDGHSAFGTGEHETTSMCIEYLQKYIKPNMTVVDVGAGTGILGMCAKKLGAKNVIMTDIDKVAVDTANTNIKLNNLTDCVVYDTNLLENVVIKGDLILANLTADILRFLAKDIISYMNNGCVIIMSGILKDRLDEVKTLYKGLGLKVLEDKTLGEWSALCMVL